MGQQHLGSQRFKWGRRGGAIAGAIILAAANANARAATLTNWQFDPATSQLELTLEAGITPTYYIETNPPRIIIELPDTNLNSAAIEQNYPGAVRSISLSPVATGGSRIILELSPEVALSPQQVQLQKTAARAGNNRWVLYPSIVSTASPRPPATVNVPPLDRAVPTPPPSVPANPPTAPIPSTPTIEFGQPLPKSSNNLGF